MSTEVGRIRCQRCRATNDLAHEFCARCGTPLMLVISSNAQRYEDMATPEPHTEHLLERISVLEYRVARITHIAERAVEMAQRQAEITDKMCDLLTKLTGAVAAWQAEVDATTQQARAAHETPRKQKSPGAGSEASSRRNKQQTLPRETKRRKSN